MKNLKIKSKLLGLLLMFIVSIFVTSCEQSEVILDNNSLAIDGDIINHGIVIHPDIVIHTVIHANVIIDKDIIPFTLVDESESVPELLCNLPTSGSLDISLYNAEKQHVRTIYKTDVVKGEYQISIDKEKLPQGLYFVHASFVSTDGTETNEGNQVTDLNQYKNNRYKTSSDI